MKYSSEDVIILRNLTGCSIIDCIRVLKHCPSIESSKECLEYLGNAVFWYKIVDGEKIHLTDEEIMIHVLTHEEDLERDKVIQYEIEIEEKELERENV